VLKPIKGRIMIYRKDEQIPQLDNYEKGEFIDSKQFKPTCVIITVKNSNTSEIHKIEVEHISAWIGKYMNSITYNSNKYNCRNIQNHYDELISKILTHKNFIFYYKLFI